MVAWLALIGVLLILAIQLWPKLSPLVSRLAAGAKGIDLRNVLIVALLLCLGAVLVGQRGCAMPEWASWSALTPSGPRVGVLVRESFDDTAQQARMINDLRSGPAAKYLAEKGHTLNILDDDETDPSDKPLPVLVSNGLAGAFANGQHKPPELLLFSGDKSLGKITIPADATADTVIAAFKAHGG